MFSEEQLINSIVLALGSRPQYSQANALLDLDVGRDITERMRHAAAMRIAAGTSWLTARQLFQRLGREPSHAPSILGRWLRQGRTFALSCRGVRVYPAYAFEGSGQPIRCLREVLCCLAGDEPVAIAAWFESRSSYLDGQRPRELIASHAARVVVAAQRHREGPSQG